MTEQDQLALIDNKERVKVVAGDTISLRDLQRLHDAMAKRTRHRAPLVMTVSAAEAGGYLTRHPHGALKPTVKSLFNAARRQCGGRDGTLIIHTARERAQETWMRVAQSALLLVWKGTNIKDALNGVLVACGKQPLGTIYGMESGGRTAPAAGACRGPKGQDHVHQRHEATDPQPGVVERSL